MGNALTMFRACTSMITQYCDAGFNEVDIMNNNHPLVSTTDERGGYNFSISNRIKGCYLIIGPIGQGAFSKVILAYDMNEGVPVAIKIYKRELYNIERMYEREVQILTYIKNKSTESRNFIVEIKKNFRHHNFPCVVTELLGPNLWSKLNGSTDQHNVSVIRKVAYCIMKGLSILKELNIIHRDIKPDNILFTDAESTSVKLVDFGCAYFKNRKPRHVAQAISFRPPEAILQLPYDFENDIWSVGCTLVHVFTGTRFVKGPCEEEVLAKIMLILGLPPLHMIRSSPVAEKYFIGLYPRFLEANTELTGPYQRRRRDLLIDLVAPCPNYFEQILAKSDDNDFIDFIKRCFVYQPENRITPAQALQHPFLIELN